MSHKIYKEIYIPYFLEVTLEVKNESPAENIHEVQIKYKNEKKWRTVYIENDTDRLEQISVHGAPFSVRTIFYSKGKSPKDKSKFLTYYPQKFIQIPKNEKCSLTYTGKTLQVDNENFVFDNSPLFDYNVLVYLQPSNPTTIYKYKTSYSVSGKFTLKTFELTSTIFLYSEDFPQNVYCYKDESKTGHLEITSSRSINQNGKTIYNVRSPHSSMPNGIFEYTISEPIQIIDTGTRMYISKEKPNFYRFEVK